MQSTVRGIHDTPAEERPTSELIRDLATQLERLVRTEMRLAQRELSQKAKEAGKGASFLTVAAVLGLFGGLTVVAGAVLLLALVLPGWAAALIIGFALLIVAGVVAMIGLARIRAQQTPLPTDTLNATKVDLRAIREAAGR